MMSAATAMALHGPVALLEKAGFALRARLAPARGAPITLISADPAIFFARVWAFRPGAPAYRILQELDDRAVHFLCCLSWNFDTRRQAARLLRLQRLVNRRERHQLLVLANCTEQQARFARLGIASIVVSASACVDESIYRPLPGRQTRYDAIYDARLAPFKQHQLAAAIPGLALITNLVDERVERRYLKEIRPLLARAHVFNGIPGTGSHRSLPPPEVNECLNEAAVGLCLSPEEGAMRASIQYLMAGLPVVSTPATGGRHEFYEPDYVKIVDPTPQAVARGVAEMMRRGVDPHEIRSRTLEKLRPHRERFVTCLEAICEARGAPRRYRKSWPEMFGNTLHLQGQLDIAATLQKIRAAAPR